MPAQSLMELPQIGSIITLHTYLNVREDAMQLFGFKTKDDLKVYKMVIGVSGIGPKGGLSILSTLTPNDLRCAVAASDVAAISATPGIGKKTAEKLIIELKDKLDLADILSVTKTGDKTDGSEHEIAIRRTEAAQALAALGYPIAQSMQAVGKAQEANVDLSVEELLKAALKFLMR